MASSSGNTPPFDFANLLKSSSNPFPPTPASYPPPPTGAFQYNQQQHYAPSPVNQMQQHEVTSASSSTNLQPQRSISFPTPPLNLQSPRDNNNNNPGTHILALLNNNNGGGGAKEPSRQVPVVNPLDVARSFPGAMVPIRVPSCKIPRGRRLSGEHAVYDVDVRVQGEVKPQLEVTPITKYGSDPQLVVGRQIAVNKDYICYGLKGGNIRVLNINTALRSLFRGHSQRVTDMAFFAEDVHLLASVSLDGKVFVWKISEGPEGDDEPQITAKIVLALQILGEEDTKHPRVCWHCHKQENLVVSIGKHVLRIDTTKVGRGEAFSAEAPLQCPLDKLIDGVQIVGKHDGEVTDLSMCQWMTTRLVSASVDGTVKIWQDRKAQPVTVLRPHDGHPVNSATFVTSPERPGHITLITGGPLNRQMKIWASAGEEGCLQADAESWKCTQTLDLKSSTESRAEEAFFNQVIALSEAGLLLLANAKRNAIYAVHLDYGSSPVVTRMDYLSEFTVTMPILSFIGTNDPAIVKVYCVQTQAIQQYTLDLCLCLPPPIENVGLEKSDYSVSREANFVEGTSEQSGLKPTELPSVGSVPKPSILVNRSESADRSSFPAGPASAETTSPSNIPSNGVPPDASNSGSVYAPSAPLPLSPRLSSTLSGYHTPVDAIEQVSPRLELGGRAPSVDYSVDRQRDTAGEKILDVSSLEENTRSQDKNVTLTPADDVSEIQSPPAFFRHPTHVVTPHLVTPSEIFRSVSSTEACIIQDVNNDARSTEVEVKEVGEARSSQNGEINYYDETENRTSDNREKIFCSQASNLSIEMARDRHPITEKNFIPKGSKANGESLQPGDESGFDSRVLSARLPESVSSSGLPQSTATFSNVANLADSYNEHSQSSSHPMTVSQYFAMQEANNQAMQEAINQILVSQKEMQKLLSNAVNGSIKEGKRIELAVGRMMERSNKSNNDALWARFQEENVKKEKASHDHDQHIVNATTSFMSKELSAMCEKIIKKESAATIPLLARAVTPVFEKAVSSAITESLQRGIGDKAVNQLDKSVNSKLETTVTRQLQAQFQTSGRQALQDAVRSSMESSVVPSFERACKTMFDQVDSAFQKGMVEHTKATLQQYESVHSPLAHTLKEAIATESSITQALSRELAESQRNHRLALAAAGTNSGASNPLVTQLSNGPLGALLEKVEAPIDPTTELKRLILERKYDESFTSALQRSDVSIVSWLCSQVDLRGLMAMNPLPLSQGVLLSLLQQLACDIANDTSRKLTWMTDVVGAINPSDQMIAVHARPIFDQVYQILHHQRNSPGSDVSAIRLIMHVINSMRMGCK